VQLDGTFGSSALTIAPAAVLLIGNGANLMSNAVDNGTLGFDQSATYTYGGVISGTGIVEQLGPGTTTLIASADRRSTPSPRRTISVHISARR
jgi:fibronectin-binding autotransporter adhesin